MQVVYEKLWFLTNISLFWLSHHNTGVVNPLTAAIASCWWRRDTGHWTLFTALDWVTVAVADVDDNNCHTELRKYSNSTNYECFNRLLLQRINKICLQEISMSTNGLFCKNDKKLCSCGETTRCFMNCHTGYNWHNTIFRSFCCLCYCWASCHV